MNVNTFDVPPPGHFIREEIEARGWTQRDLAYVLGITDPEVNIIISGKRGISPEMAKSLGKVFDVPPDFLSNLQIAYDLARAREPNPDIERKARLQTVFPVREMIKRGWLTDASAGLLESELAQFFEVTSINDVPQLAHAAKKTSYDHIPPAQLAWLFRVRHIAKAMDLPAYSESALRAALPSIKALMIDPTDVQRLPAILAQCGVRFVVVESLPNAKIDGACFWLDDATPIIGVSLFRDRIDNFWFVVRHEIEHVLRKHGRDKVIVDVEIENSSNLNDDERIANDAAQDFCVPSSEMNSFIERKSPYFSEKDVLGFAKRLQIHPGIVAGQLRRRLDRWDIFSKLLVKVRHSVISKSAVDGWGQVASVKH